LLAYFGRIRDIISSIPVQDQMLGSWKHDKSYKISMSYYKRKNPHIGYEASRLKVSWKGIEGKSKAP
jgi:type II secretory pathway component PulJ